MFRVVITDCLSEPAAIEREVLSGIATVECWEATAGSELAGRLDGVDAVIVYHEVALTAALVAGMSRCRIIARGGVGYDNVDLAAAAARGIIVTNVPDYGVDEVADHAVGLMLALRRGICRCQQQLRGGLAPWDRRAVEPLQRLAGQTFGVIGCGRIGTATALRAKALRMEVMFHDPYLAPGIEKALNLRRAYHLDELLAGSDVVSIHAPLTAETRGMLNAPAISRMRQGAVLVNTARGAIADTGALAAAIADGSLGGVAIDVLPEEPATLDDPLVRLWQAGGAGSERVILTPHIAYYSEQGLEEIRRSTAEEVRRVLCGEVPRHPVAAAVPVSRASAGIA